MILRSDTSFMLSHCMKDKVGSTTNSFRAVLRHDRHLYRRGVLLPRLIIFITWHAAYKWLGFLFHTCADSKHCLQSRTGETRTERTRSSYCSQFHRMNLTLSLSDHHTSACICCLTLNIISTQQHKVLLESPSKLKTTNPLRLQLAAVIINASKFGKVRISL